MTTEEKARAYDEVLEIARCWLNSSQIIQDCNYTIEDAIQNIFPQLAESEDERTRKELVEYHKQLFEKNRDQEVGLFHKNALTYLEKQKDLDKMIVVSPEVWDNAISDAFENGKKEGEKQKEPIPIPDKFSGLKSLMLQYLQSAANQKDDTEIESDTDLWGRKILDYVWKYSDEQKEQKRYWKPTETDIALFNKAVTTNKALTPAERAQLDIVRSKFGCCRAVNCSGIVQKEQKPSIFPPGLGEVRWNPIPSAKKELMEKAAEKLSKEEYVKKFKTLCGLYEIKLPNREYDIYGLCEDLHKLFGDIQKPAEWSEEDERIRNQLIYDVERHKKEGLISAKQNKATKALYNGIEECYDEKIAWLKSLPLNLKKKNEDVAKLCSNEWNEEDEEALDMCLDAIPKRWETKSGIPLTKWLKDNIHLQPKQEWSEEDERIRKGLINFLRSSFIKENITDEMVAPWIAYLERQKPFVTIPATEIVKNEPMEMPSGESLDALADVVQAKDWKPNEEQMEALNYAIQVLVPRAAKASEELEILCEQLQRLM